LASLQAILMLRSPDTMVSISDLPSDYIESPSLVARNDKVKGSKRAYKKRDKTPTAKELKAIAAAAVSFDMAECASSRCSALYSAAPLRYLSDSLPSTHFFDHPDSAPHSLQHPKLKRKNFSAPPFVLDDLQSESMVHQLQSQHGQPQESCSLSALTAAAVAMAQIDGDRSSRQNGGSIPHTQVLERRSESRSTVTSSESVDVASLIDISPRCSKDPSSMFSSLPSPTNTDPESTSRDVSPSPKATKEDHGITSSDNLDSELSVDSHEYLLNTVR